MKTYLSIFVAAAIVATPYVFANTTGNSTPETETVAEKAGAVDGMYFSTANVVEEYELDGALCVVYDDPDAGMSEVGIYVDAQTYATCVVAAKAGFEAVGMLVETKNRTSGGEVIFTLTDEPEFDMATASADL